MCDDNAGVGSGGCVVAVSAAYMGGTRDSGVCLVHAGDVLEMSVVRGGVCDVYVFGSGWGGRCWGREDWVWALPILEEHGESGICVCVAVVLVVLGGVGGQLGPGSWEGGVVFCLCVL